MFCGDALVFCGDALVFCGDALVFCGDALVFCGEASVFCGEAARESKSPGRVSLDAPLRTALSSSWIWRLGCMGRRARGIVDELVDVRGTRNAH